MTTVNTLMPPPILISIGSFLIDAFDTPPRPTTDSIPLRPHPSLKRGAPNGPPTPESPSVPSTPFIPRVPSPQRRSRSPHPAHNNGHAPALSGPSLPRKSLETPMCTPPGSGATTPQLQFDEPAPDHPFEYLGGGGLYNLTGARMFLPPARLKALVDRAPGGADLRPDLLAQVQDYGDMWVWNENASTRMCRSRIRYDGDTRLFQYLVPPPSRKMADMVQSPLQGARYMHISPPFSAEDVAGLQAEIQQLVSDGTPGAWQPRTVFEPTPPSCHVGQRGWLEKVAPGIHVLTPNHEELLSFYGHPKLGINDPMLVLTLEAVMRHLLEDVGVGAGGDGILAIRCGRMGCCIGTRRGGLRWFPAYYGDGEEENVRDVTGAGNAFIGGYIAGLYLTDEDPYAAALYGTVAASFVVERFGLPTVTKEEGREYWNGASPVERLAALREKWTLAGLL